MTMSVVTPAPDLGVPKVCKPIRQCAPRFEIANPEDPESGVFNRLANIESAARPPTDVE
jgi:hypothetical protein